MDKLIYIDIDDYLKNFKELPLIDVRTPAEYLKGHIPYAYNIPLFSNEERAHIGTVYKKQSRSQAIEVGLSYAKPKHEEYVSKACEIAPQKQVVIHCWRGGMRSKAFAEHLVNNGFRKVYIIRSGYKAFRRYAMDSFKNLFQLCIIGGYTGSGKTRMLHSLRSMGKQAIDLEGHARHKGSAFGAIGQSKQPDTEHFTNELFWELKEMDKQKPLWLEDESIHIGRIFLPEVLFNQMRQTHLFFFNISIEQRVNLLIQEYANFNNQLLAASVQRISKRLGGENTKKAIHSIEQNDYEQAVRIVLNYYDKYYLQGLQKRQKDKVHIIHSTSTDPDYNASLLLKEYEKLIDRK